MMAEVAVLQETFTSLGNSGLSHDKQGIKGFACYFQPSPASHESAIHPWAYNAGTRL
jgi:hypothetical protein